MRDPLLDVTPTGSPTELDPDFIDRVVDAQRVLEHLRTHPLLGAERSHATSRIGFVAAVLGEVPDPLASADLFGLAGDLALASGSGEAVDRYLRGAAAAERKGDAVRARRLHLHACRAVALLRGPSAAQSFFEELGSPPEEPCAAAHALAAAACEPDLADAHLCAALAHLSAPRLAHHRAQALLDLAEHRWIGGDTEAAQRRAAEASALGQAHAAPEVTAEAEALLGALQLERGRPSEAVVHLTAACEQALEAEDTLAALTHATTLTPLHLAAEDWAAAEHTARLELRLGDQRGHWLAVASGALGWSATLLARGHLAGAVGVLVTTGTTLKAEGASAAANLLQARLAELQAIHGRARIEPLVAKLQRSRLG